MLSQAWRTCAATASRPPGSPRNAGAKSITGIVRVTSATSFRPRLAIPDQLPAGRLVTIATVESSPPISAGLLVLARSDVSVGRNRIWRPHKALFRELPNALHPALNGSRNGSYEVNRAS